MMRDEPQGRKWVYVLLCLLVCGPFISGKAWAYGNISTTYKYAWSENAGWANFHPSHGGVTVHDTYLSGYAWAANVGWVKLGSGSGPYANTNSANWGVNLDSATGKLSGYGWSENCGWINFDSSHGEVTISTTTGKFDGYAWGANVGWIHFQNTSPEYYVMKDTSRASILYVSKDDATCGGNSPCFDSIQTAISLGDSDATIRIAEGQYSETLALSESKSLTLSGGWDSGFTAQTPNKTIIKAPSVPQGSLTLQELIVQP